jgi:hypothetical protein
LGRQNKKRLDGSLTSPCSLESSTSSSWDTTGEFCLPYQGESLEPKLWRPSRPDLTIFFSSIRSSGFPQVRWSCRRYCFPSRKPFRRSSSSSGSSSLRLCLKLDFEALFPDSPLRLPLSSFPLCPCRPGSNLSETSGATPLFLRSSPLELLMEIEQTSTSRM